MHEYLDDYFTDVNPVVARLVQDAILPYFAECETCPRREPCNGQLRAGKTLPLCLDAIVMLGWLAVLASVNRSGDRRTHA